jgi:hypothetical protein
MARLRPPAGQFVAGAIFRLFDSDQKTFPADAVSECICRRYKTENYRSIIIICFAIGRGPSRMTRTMPAQASERPYENATAADHASMRARFSPIVSFDQTKEEGGSYVTQP